MKTNQREYLLCHQEKVIICLTRAPVQITLTLSTKVAVMFSSMEGARSYVRLSLIYLVHIWASSL